jgi:tRNA(Ile)-lysidine synthase
MLPVHSLSQRVLSCIQERELLSAGDRVGVAVSGGIDSVALLRLLLELRRDLGIVLSVAHFNHKLRGAESDGDREFVAELARRLEMEFYCDGHDTGQYSAEKECSIEAAARELRYGFFDRLLGAGERAHGADNPQGGGKPPLLSTNTAETAPFRNVFSAETPFPNNAPTNFLNTICTAHTLDDQAETVFMRIIRGTGLRGLGAIHPQLLVEDDAGEVCGEIVRPLLGFRRSELEQYLRDLRQPWRDDASNADDRFTRNRIRHTLLPLVEREFNPSVAENLAELSEIARGEEDYWENEAAGWMGRTVQWSEPDWVRPPSEQKGLVQIGGFRDGPSPCASFDFSLEARIESAPWLVVNGSVDRMWLLGEPLAVQRRVIKAMGDHVRLPLEFKHIEEVLRFGGEDGKPGKELSLPHGWRIVRHAEALVLITPDLREQDDDPPAYANDYEYDLPLPGRVVVAETGFSFETERIAANANIEAKDSGSCLDAGSLPGRLRVRNWRPGDRFRPAHTKSSKKVKELLHGRNLEPRERKLWPVIVSGDVIVWVRGFAAPAEFQAKTGREAVLIIETPVRR